MLWNLELLLPDLGTVGFHDGNRGRLLLSGLKSPNGINKSPDGKYVGLFINRINDVFGCLYSAILVFCLFKMASPMSFKTIHK